MEFQNFIYLLLAFAWFAGFLWAFSIVMKCRRKK
nr:MAG TPA: chitin synthase regulator [Caudoviricetes sp.]